MGGMQAACTPVGARMDMACSALQRKGSTPSLANVVWGWSTTGRAEVDATGDASRSDLELLDDMVVKWRESLKAELSASYARLSATSPSSQLLAINLQACSRFKQYHRIFFRAPDEKLGVQTRHRRSESEAATPPSREQVGSSQLDFLLLRSFLNLQLRSTQLLTSWSR